MNGIDPSQLPSERVKNIAMTLCEDSATHYGHEVKEEIHPSGENLLDRLFYRAMPEEGLIKTNWLL